MTCIQMYYVLNNSKSVMSSSCGLIVTKLNPSHLLTYHLISTHISLNILQLVIKNGTVNVLNNQMKIKLCFSFEICLFLKKKYLSNIL